MFVGCEAMCVYSCLFGSMRQGLLQESRTPILAQHPHPDLKRKGKLKDAPPALVVLPLSALP